MFAYTLSLHHIFFGFYPSLILKHKLHHLFALSLLTVCILLYLSSFGSVSLVIPLYFTFLSFLLYLFYHIVTSASLKTVSRSLFIIFSHPFCILSHLALVSFFHLRTQFCLFAQPLCIHLSLFLPLFFTRIRLYINFLFALSLLVHLFSS